MNQRARYATLALCLVLAVAHTWPLASAPHRLSLNHNADAQLNAWIVSWIAHTLPASPGDVWRGNIFQPDAAALTLSEPLIAPALLGAPLIWAGGSAVLVFNLLLIAGLAITAWVTTLVVTRATGSLAGGVLAGVFFAFNTHLLTRLPHLQAAHAWGLPLIWGATWARLHNTGRVWWVPLAVALTAATSLHWLVFGVMGAALMAVVGRHPIRLIGRVAIEGLAGITLALPVLWPHLVGGVTRPLDQVAQFSATPLGWLTSLSLLHKTWSSAWFTAETNLWFPGLTIVALAAVGLWHSGRSHPLARWALLMIVVGFVLSLGTLTPVYGWAYEVFPPMRGIRAASRFGMLAYAGLAILAALGTTRLLSMVAHARTIAVAVVLVALVSIEHWHGAVRTTPFDGIPRLYSLLRDEPGPVLLAEMPFYPPDGVFQNGDYVLNATGHWRDVMNGYSGVTPMSYRRYSEFLWYFPDARAFPVLAQAGATHVMVHLDRFGSDRAATEAALQQRPELRLLAADRDGRRLYRLVRE